MLRGCRRGFPSGCAGGGTSAGARRDRVDERHELGDVVAVAAGQRDRDGDAVRFDDDVVFRACPGTVGPGSAEFWATFESAHMRAVDHRLGPVQRTRGVQLRQQLFMQPLPHARFMPSRSRRQQVIPDP